MTVVIDEWTDERIAELEHVFIGPTWQRDENGNWLLPKYTLGWQISDWVNENLYAPDSVADAFGIRDPFVFTDEQLRFVLWWYAVDENGEWLYQTGILQRLKGWGKDPLAAVLTYVEIAGPSKFGGWDLNNEPIGIVNQSAVVHLAAVTQAQTQNTTDMFPALITPQLQASAKIEMGAENLWAWSRRTRAQAATSNPRALQGSRPTLSLLNETHEWVKANKGHAMLDVVEGNAAKAGRILAITNAFLPGEDSVAERMRLAYDEQSDGYDTKTLYDSVEAAPETPLMPHVLRKVLPVMMGDSVWMLKRLDIIIASIMKKSTRTAYARRMWLNQIVSHDDALIPLRVWDELKADDEDSLLQPDDPIVLGFDGGLTNDTTALVAIRIRDGLVVPLGIWEPTEEEGWVEYLRREVNNAVHGAFRRYSVRAFLCDVRHWESQIADWSEAYREVLEVRVSESSAVAWDMRNSRNATLAHERLLSSIEAGKIQHQGQRTELSSMLRTHVMNTRRRENRHGVSFGKESKESPNKVDAYAAMMLAHEGLVLWRARRKANETKSRKTSGRVWSMASS